MIVKDWIIELIFRRELPSPSIQLSWVSGCYCKYD